MISDKLKELNIDLPNAPDPVGAYVAFKKIGNFLYISGQLPISSEGKMIKGKIGKDLTLEDGQKASRLCILNILAQTKKALNGNLDKVKNCIKITGYVIFRDENIDSSIEVTSCEDYEVIIGLDGSKSTYPVNSNSQEIFCVCGGILRAN